MNLLDSIPTVNPTVDTDAERACCCYVQAVVEAAAKLPPATGDLLAKWRIFAGQGPWSPVEAAVQSGAAVSIVVPPSNPVLWRGRWHVIQGWRGAPLAAGVTGHTFLWYASDTDPARGVQFDSAIPRGPGSRTRSWADVLAEFRGGVAVAALR